MTAKEQAISVLNRLPEDCSLEDIEYELGIIRLLQERVAEADDPNTQWVPHEQVMAEMKAKWREKLSG